MPRIPVIQHQNSAPGPPMAIAVETPTILPVPSVAASVVASAAKPDRLAPFPSISGVTDRRMAFRVSFWGNFSFCGKIQMGGGEEYKNGKTPQQLIDVFQNGKHTGLTVFSILYAAGDRDMYAG